LAPSAEALTIKDSITLHEGVAVLAMYRNSFRMNDLQLKNMLHAVGFKGTALKHAWAISKKESNGNPLSHNGNAKTGDNSYGIFQINMIGALGEERRAKYGLKSNAELFDPVTNAKIAYHMSKGGKDWSAWKGTNTTVVKRWLGEFPEQTVKTQSKQKSKT
jgi:hypothetical protein